MGFKRLSRCFQGQLPARNYGFRSEGLNVSGCRIPRSRLGRVEWACFTPLASAEPLM